MWGMASCRRAGMRVVACVLALWVMLVTPMPGASAATKGPTVTRISVVPSRVWTNTGVALRAGDQITIRARGRIHFGAPPIDRLSPTGIPRGKLCDAINARVPGTSVWPAPLLDCWSLIARIGNGAPFPIATAKTFHAASDGELYLGVNDNFLRDNSGTWSATLVVTPPPAKSSTNLLPYVLIGVAILGALVGIVFLVARARRATRARPPRAKPQRAHKPAPTQAAAAAPTAVPSERVLRAGVAVPGNGEFTEVNIFEVEFADSTSLRVGYNYFPEGTLVHWQVAQRTRAPVAGEFVTDGGGSTYHFVDIALGGELEPNPDGADVIFTWDIGGVPFHYSVRRDLVR